MSLKTIIALLALNGCSESSMSINPLSTYTESHLGQKYIENHGDTFTFIDENPSSKTYGQLYSFTPRENEESEYQQNVISFGSLNTPILFNWFEPWCYPCMMELPNLERLVQEDKVPVFGFTSDFQQYPSTNNVPIEDAVTFPIFKIDPENQVYKTFLHSLNSYGDETIIGPGAKEIVASVEIPAVPRTLIVYGANNYCLTFNQTYEGFLDQMVFESCPKIVLKKQE